MWIGSDVIILEGCKIDDGAVIASGSIVTKDVKAFEIWAGVPARKIKDRFSPADKEKLIMYKWWANDLEFLKNKSNEFRNINTLNFDK